MNNVMRLPLAIAMLGMMTVGMVGCSIAPPSQFYQLHQQAVEVTGRKNNATVLLGPLKIADYLQRENMVQRQADGTLDISQTARWAGSLQNDIGQLLLRQIASQLGTSQISLYPDRVGIDAQAQVVLSISRLDSGVEQPAVLEAQWRLLDAKGTLRNSQVLRLEQAHNGELGDQVRAQSDLLGQLLQQLVEALQKTLPAAAKKQTYKPNPSAGQRKGMTPKAETLGAPVVEHGRESEVYRF